DATPLAPRDCSRVRRSHPVVQMPGTREWLHNRPNIRARPRFHPGVNPFGTRQTPKAALARAWGVAPTRWLSGDRSTSAGTTHQMSTRQEVGGKVWIR